MGIWPLVLPLLAAGTVVLTVVFADQTLATVLEATRIRTAIGPSQAWYTENLRYYYLILPTVDGSMSRRFGFLITALCLFTSMFIMLRRKRIPGVARGPAWRLMGVIFATMFFLMFTPTKWVHHFGLFAAVGAAMAALATVLVSPTVLRWSRNRMTFLTALLFVLALCWATTNGWWYVSSYGVPFNNTMPQIAGITVSTIFLALFAIAAIYTVWLHFAPRDRGEGRIARLLTAAPVPVAAGFMVLVFVASMLVGAVRQYPTYSNAWANLRAFAGGCGLADDVLVEPDPNDGFLTPLPGDTARLARWVASNPVGFTPNGVPDHIVAESIRLPNPASGHGLRLGCAGQAEQSGRQRLDGAAALRPRPRPGSAGRLLRRGSAAAEHAELGVVPVAAGRRRAPAGGRHRRRNHRGQQRAQRAHRRPGRRIGVRAAGARRCPGSGGPLGALRPRSHSVVAQSALPAARASPPTRRWCGWSPRTSR